MLSLLVDGFVNMYNIIYPMYLMQLSVSILCTSAHATLHTTTDSLNSSLTQLHVHKPFVMGMNGCKKNIIAVLKRQTTKDQGSCKTSTPPPPTGNFFHLLLLLDTHPSPPPHRGMEGGRAGYPTKEQGSFNNSLLSFRKFLSSTYCS